jgi:hypothetical protein
MQAPGEGLIIKMWDSLVDKGIGALLKPWQTRRQGSADADVRARELLTLASARRTADAIARGDLQVEWTPGLLLKHETTEEIPSWHGACVSSAGSVVAEKLRHDANVAAAVLCAESVLENDATPTPDAAVDEDWLRVWRENAGRMSAAEVQDLWGRILAGEVKSPGTYSLRALEFLRNVNHAEATRIGAVAQFLINNSVFRASDSLFESGGIDFDALLELQCLGILSGVEALGITMKITSADPTTFVRALAGRTLGIFVKGADASKTFTYPTYNVTSLGKEIFTLSDAKTNSKYIRELGEHVKAQGFEVSVGNANRLQGDKFVLTNLQPI